MSSHPNRSWLGHTSSTSSGSVGSYTCATITSLNEDIARLRLQAFHTLIHRAPEASLHSLAAQAGLQMGERLQQDFKQEFLVSIEEHRRHCYRRHRSQA